MGQISRKIRKLTGLTLFPVLMWSAAGSAAVFDFVVPGPGSSSASVLMSVDGIGLTVTAGSSSGSELVFRGNKGLGVDSGITDLNNALDGFGVDEYLEFQFTSAVKLTHIVFENVDLVFDDDESGLAVDGVFFGGGGIPDGLDIAGAVTTCTGVLVKQCTVDLSLANPAAVGSLFRIGDLLSGFDLDLDDNFLISSITVENMPVIGVPEPGALGLLLMGALVTGAAGRFGRRSRGEPRSSR